MDLTKSLVGFSLFIGAAIFVWLRLFKGVDLGDEAYYAIFIDDWLKGGFSQSSFRNLHLTAALLIYPFAVAYRWLLGTSNGLFLFLREIYLFGAVMSALLWVYYLRIMGYRVIAWASGALLVSFVPFGLPAPSYNTTSGQGLIVALAAFGCAFSPSLPGLHRKVWLGLSALAWAIATVAYPPVLGAALLICLLVLVISLKETPIKAFYCIAILTTIAVGWLLVFYLLTPTTIIESIKYQYALRAPSRSFISKTNFLIQIFADNKIFLALVLSSLTIGIVRRWLAHWQVILLISCVLGISLLAPPALFMASHDIVTLLALTGIGLIADLRRGSSDQEKAAAIIYVTSMAAGVIMYVTTSNSGFNFCIGAAAAGSLSITGLHSDGRGARGALVPTIIAGLIILRSSMTMLYGEIPFDQTRARTYFPNTWFAGIGFEPDDAALLQGLQDQIVPQLGAAKSVAIFGRKPGLVLATSLRLRMPSAFPPDVDALESGVEILRQFHRQNPPDVVLIYRDKYFEPLIPMASDIATSFVPVAQAKTAIGDLSLFAKE